MILGNTWTQYESNPIIENPGMKDFRDPNIIKRNGVYYMALAAGDRIMFYSSENLLDWKQLNEFGLVPNYGDKSGVWECPSIVSLKDEQGNNHDILFVSENGDSRGSLWQYFVGKFNENGFTTIYGESNIFWADHGPDNYAAIPYHNDPKNRVIIIGWMNNWLYGQIIPTTTWRGQMTIPRELALKTIDGRIHLTQKPIEEFATIKDSSKVWNLPSSLIIAGEKTIDISSRMSFKTGSFAFRIIQLFL